MGTLTGESNRANTVAIDRADNAAINAESLVARGSTRVFSDVGEGERRAFGALKEASPGEV